MIEIEKIVGIILISTSIEHGCGKEKKKIFFKSHHRTKYLYLTLCKWLTSKIVTPAIKLKKLSILRRRNSVAAMEENEFTVLGRTIDDRHVSVRQISREQLKSKKQILLL